MTTSQHSVKRKWHILKSNLYLNCGCGILDVSSKLSEYQLHVLLTWDNHADLIVSVAHILKLERYT